MRTLLASAAVSAGLLATSATAQNCAPFTDVLASDTFCSNIQWMYNRSITLGCATNQYCPAQFVRRDQMAAFMNRLGNVVYQQGGNAFGATAVLGTTDGQPLDLRVDGNRVMRYEPRAVPNVIGGSATNQVTQGSVGSTIGGGGSPIAPNQVAGSHGTVSGGYGNAAGAYGTVAGGRGNSAGGEYATVGGGLSNQATSYAATVVGGDSNVASGLQSSVLGGAFNTATGLASVAIGYNGDANEALCMVVSLWSSAPGMNCLGSGYIVRIGAHHGMSVEYGSQRADGGGSRWVYIGDGFGGQAIATSTGAYLSYPGGIWQDNSDVEKKEAFADIDREEVLETLAALPIRSWRYKGESDDIRHVGPTAQDFMAAFRLGEDEKTIGGVDAQGIALAAIQGLHEKVRAQAREIAELREAVAALLRAGQTTHAVRQVPR